jgi:hypothetical protein
MTLVTRRKNRRRRRRRKMIRGVVSQCEKGMK